MIFTGKTKEGNEIEGQLLVSGIANHCFIVTNITTYHYKDSIKIANMDCEYVIAATVREKLENNDEQQN